jgi:hypothetical protein
MCTSNETKTLENMLNMSRDSTSNPALGKNLFHSAKPPLPHFIHLLAVYTVAKLIMTE